MKSKNTNLNKFESSKIIQQQIERWAQLGEGLSIREWAKLIGVSHSYLSLVLNSDRLISPKALAKLALALDLDKQSRKNLTEARERDWMKLKKIKTSSVHLSDSQKQSAAFADEILDDSVILKSWIHIAFLDFTTCVGFTSDLKESAECFNISISQMQSVVHDLERAGLLKKIGHQYIKVSENVRVPTPRSTQSIRSFHMAMMKKAIKTLEKVPTAEEVSKRLINSYTVAVNEEQLSSAFEQLNKAFYEVVDQLRAGECTSVYQIQFQVMPLVSIKQPS